MSKEAGCKQYPPNVVAKLMGLDALPQQQQESASETGHSRRSYSRSRLVMSDDYWKEEHGFVETLQPQIHRYPLQNDYKDAYEIWHSRNNYVNDNSPRKEGFNRGRSVEKIDLVCQNFVELKRLATDEKLRQSKQFEDALEVLSSNNDSFLEFLQQPNSMFSQHCHGMQSIPLPPEKKRITVLKPARILNNSKFAECGKKNGKQVNGTSQFSQVNRRHKSTSELSLPTSKLEDSHTRATRIVVLKPNSGKSHDMRLASPPFSSPRALNVSASYGEPEDDNAQEFRDVAKGIARQMCENLSGLRRDGTLLSSMISNGYSGDESSFCKSENEYTAKYLSDIEVMSSTSRHSWDCVNRLGSPYSFSSVSRASYSPESSVGQEAKKRLSERWAMMASNGICQDQRHNRRSSSTLGEMLAVSDMKESVRSIEDGRSAEQESRASTSCLATDSNDRDIRDTSSPRNLSRSKSVPICSTAYDASPSLQVSDHKMEKPNVTKEVAKEKSTKSSFKGRVSSLFFSRNKKSSKANPVQLIDDIIESSGRRKFSPENDVDASAHVTEEEVSPNPHESSSDTCSLDSLCMPKKQAEFSVAMSCTNVNFNENQEQPSPISVLEPPFYEDEDREGDFSKDFNPERDGLTLRVRSIKSNLIDKSPLIGSITRTLSWDDSCMETATPYPLKSHLGPMLADGEQQEWFFLVQALLSAANFDTEAVQSDTFLDRWHSLESPLDPSLRDNKYIDLYDKKTVHEAKSRQRRSTRKLVFDCVNAALVDIAGYRSDPLRRETSYYGPSATTVTDRVWARLKQMFSDEVRCVFDECGDKDNNSQVVERMVRKEVVGKEWVEHLRLELDNFRLEIESKLLEDLVQEAVEEFTGRM